MRKIALFDKPLPYIITEWHDEAAKRGGFKADFRTPNRQDFDVDAIVKTIQVEPPDPPYLDMYILFENKTNDSSGYNPFGTTGKGEEFAVFSTVSKIILEMYDRLRAKRNERIVVRYDAEQSELSRQKLYAKLAQGLARLRGGQVAVRRGEYQMLYTIIFPSKRPPSEQSPADQL